MADEWGGGTEFASDLFTETSDVNLDSHTPDTGSGWTLDLTWGSPTNTLKIYSTNDRCGGSGLDGTAGRVYTIDTAPSTPNVEVEYVLSVEDTTVDRCVLLIARHQSGDTGYAACIGSDTSTDAFTTNNLQIFSYGATSRTKLAEVAQDWAGGEVIVFQVIGDTLKIFVDGVDTLTAVDGSITGAGKVGIGAGMYNSQWAMDSGWRVDSFKARYYNIDGVPQTIHPPNNSYIPPVRDSNGTEYVFGIANSAQNSIGAWKKSASDDTFTQMDGANRPTNNSNNINCVSLMYDTTNNVVHLVYCNTGTSPTYRYARYALSDEATNPDTWRIADETIEAVTIDSSGGLGLTGTCRIEYVGGSTPVKVFYQGDEDNNKGTKWQRVDYAHRAFAEGSTTWTVDNQVEGTTSTAEHQVFNDAIQGASGKTYIIYKDATNSDLHSRSLTQANSLGTVRTVEGTTDPENYLAIHGAYYDAAGTERITIGYRHADKVNTVIIDADGAPDTADTASDNNIKLIGTNTSAGNLFPNTADQVYLIYVHATNDDIYQDTNNNDGGWGTDTAEVATITADSVFGTFYNSLVAVVYEVGNDLVYAELSNIQTISPSGISQSIVYNTHRLNQNIDHSALSVSQNFGTHRVNQSIDHSGVSQGQNFGTHVLTQSIQHAGLSVTVDYGTHLILTDTISPNGISQAINYGTHALDQSIAHSGLSQGINYGTHVLDQFIVHAGLSVSVNYGTHLIEQSIQHSGLSVGINYGAHDVANDGGLLIEHTGLSQAINYGTHVLDQFISHSALVAGINFGTHLLNQFIVHSGLSQAINSGTHQLIFNIQPSGISVGINYGTHLVFTDIISPNGLSIAISFGTHKLNQQVVHSALSQAISYGSHSVELNIQPTGLSVSVSYGTHILDQFIAHNALVVSPAYGSHVVQGAITPDGILQGIDYGTHLLNQQIVHTGLSVSINYGSHQSNLSILHSGLSQVIDYGTHILDQNITHSALSVPVNFGAHQVQFNQTITHVGLSVSISYGDHTVAGVFNIIPPNSGGFNQIADGSGSFTVITDNSGAFVIIP